MGNDTIERKKIREIREIRAMQKVLLKETDVPAYLLEDAKQEIALLHLTYLDADTVERMFRQWLISETTWRDHEEMCSMRRGTYTLR